MAKRKNIPAKGKDKAARDAERLDIDAMLEELDQYDEFDKKPKKAQATKNRGRGARQEATPSAAKKSTPALLKTATGNACRQGKGQCI